MILGPKLHRSAEKVQVVPIASIRLMDAGAGTCQRKGAGLVRADHSEMNQTRDSKAADISRP